MAQDKVDKEVLHVDLRYFQSGIKLVAVTKLLSDIVPSFLNQPDKGYSMTLKDSGNKVLLSFRFNFLSGVYVHEGLNSFNKTVTITPEGTEAVLAVPVLQDMKLITITDESGRVLIAQDVSGIAGEKLTAKQELRKFSNLLTLQTIGGGVAGILVVIGLAFWFIRKRKSSTPAT